MRLYLFPLLSPVRTPPWATLDQVLAELPEDGSGARGLLTYLATLEGTRRGALVELGWMLFSWATDGLVWALRALPLPTRQLNGWRIKWLGWLIDWGPEEQPSWQSSIVLPPQARQCRAQCGSGHQCHYDAGHDGPHFFTCTGRDP